ncbi:MAG: hypothetical protein H6897_00080 [Rhodobacteraceae bacterium]|jgi:ethanolamine ammonia-lyase large subunit|uniref:hypothetical protein n=1 Tax=Albidovulum sp. TaxID=1872424 RepID=UPI001D554990|nr:hypothetical protein [uncultured Defluviimonas sp.]MCB2125790.1 hypothetical protein [Paracoccaceae bacterium]MCC0068311.1 hypothetical protein [Paracoccaceae bacterium]
MRTALGTDAVAAVGAAAFWWGTGQGGALTSEAARRLDIATAPCGLPDVTLRDQTGAETRM